MEREYTNAECVSTCPTSLEPRYVLHTTVSRPAIAAADSITVNDEEKKLHLLQMANTDDYNNQARLIDALENLAVNIRNDPKELKTNKYFKKHLETLETYWGDVQCNDELLIRELSRSHHYFDNDEYSRAEKLYVATKDLLNEQYQVFVVRKNEMEDSQSISGTSNSSQDQAKYDNAEGSDHDKANGDFNDLPQSTTESVFSLDTSYLPMHWTNNEGLTNGGGRRVVKAVCGYTACTLLDICFKEGDRMEVLDDTRPDWWGVLHLRTMTQGLVPVNLIAEETLESEDWFFPHVSRKEAEKLLLAKCSNNPIGTFLVRPAEFNKLYRFTLSVKVWDDGYYVKHYRIMLSDNGEFYIEANQTFSSLSELIMTYTYPSYGLTRPCPMPPSMCEVCDTIEDLTFTVEESKPTTPDDGYVTFQPSTKPTGLLDVAEEIRSLLEELVKFKKSMGPVMEKLADEIDSRVGELLTKMAESDGEMAKCSIEKPEVVSPDLATLEPVPASKLEPTSATGLVAPAYILKQEVESPAPLLDLATLEPVPASDPDLATCELNSHQDQIFRLLMNVCFWFWVFLYVPYYVLIK